LHPEDNSSTLTLYQELVAGNIDHYRVANRLLTKDGRRLWLDFTVSLIRGVKGEPLFAIAMGQDITDHEEAAERISRYHRRLQGLAAQLEEVQEAERRLLTRELHDRVGQNLGVLGINLNLLQSLVQEGDNNQIQIRLADSVAVVEQTVALIRDLMAELRPPELDDYGLLEALRSYGAKFSHRTNIAVDVAGEDLTPRLEPSVEISLFRIVQEALTNVAKHAQATRVRVTKNVDEGKVRLTIADNGAGFDRTRQENAKGRQGWGLITMTERAVAAGGHCRIESRPGEGTRVIVEVPR
jgi:two-component system sensor histidine kinase UhpB